MRVRKPLRLERPVPMLARGCPFKRCPFRSATVDGDAIAEGSCAARAVRAGRSQLKSPELPSTGGPTRSPDQELRRAMAAAGAGSNTRVEPTERETLGCPERAFVNSRSSVTGDRRRNEVIDRYLINAWGVQASAGSRRARWHDHLPGTRCPGEGDCPERNACRPKITVSKDARLRGKGPVGITAVRLLSCHDYRLSETKGNEAPGNPFEKSSPSGRVTASRESHNKSLPINML